MLTFEMIIVFLGLIGMVTALVLDKMRPGMILFSVTVLFLCFGILTPKEILEGFSNKGMITVALLFLISEGVRQSGALGQLIKKLLPQEKTTVMKAQARMLPAISFVSAFLNNTPVVVIFAPIIKRWAESVRIPATKFLIPLSYATILGGMCTLIGTSTNLVVDGMILDAGYKGFGMFELGRVGIFIALAGIVYLLFFSSRLLPEVRKDTVGDEHGEADASSFHRVEAVIGARFPGINKRVGDFNFVRHYGAEVKEIRFGPQTDDHDYNFKLKHAIGFLQDGDKVKAYVFFKGRSILFKEQGEVLLLRFANDLEEYAKVEQMPLLEGKRMTISLAPKKAGSPKKAEMDTAKKENPKKAVEAKE